MSVMDDAPGNEVATQDHSCTTLAIGSSGQYSRKVADRWDELIDWDKRAAGEGTFFIDRLHEIGARRVIDVSAGSGFHSVQLRKAGFDVLACDGSPYMVERAKINFQNHCVAIPIKQIEWLNLDSRLLGTFDAVVCLGSSLCHVFDGHTRHQVLKRFRDLLRPGGLLIVDQRNYQAIRAGRFKSTGQYYYCGVTAHMGLGEFNDNMCEIIYTFSDMASFNLRVYPILPAQMRGEIEMADFARTQAYGDFKTIYDALGSNFIVHTAIAQ